MKVFIGDYVEDADRDVEVEIHPYDTWNLDDTLALIIVPSLKAFLDDPASLFQVSPEDTPHIRHEESEKVMMERFEWVMSEMIWAFSQCLETSDVLDNISDEHEKRIKQGLYLFAKYFRSLWN